MQQSPDDFAPPPRNKSEPEPLDVIDVSGWMDAAEDREDPYWLAIMAYVRGPLRKRQPARSRLIEKQLKWLRHQAHIDGEGWGRPDKE